MYEVRKRCLEEMMGSGEEISKEESMLKVKKGDMLEVKEKCLKLREMLEMKKRNLK